MAFKLNVSQPFHAQPPRRSMAALLVETRQVLQIQGAGVRSFDWRSTQAALAVAIFALGFSAATLRATHAGRTEAYDMAPTGSIAKKDPAALPKSRACE